MRKRVKWRRQLWAGAPAGSDGGLIKKQKPPAVQLAEPSEPPAFPQPGVVTNLEIRGLGWVKRN